MKTETTTKMLIGIILFGLCIVMTSSSVSAASTVYVNATGGSDSNIGTIDQPYQTIQKGIDSVDTNGTVTLSNGTYTGTGNTNITISKNVNITGQSQTGTIINGTGTNWIFKISTGATVTISNLTITNATANSGSAIYNTGTLTITNCTLTNNTATYYGGGAIYNKGTINSITNSTFTNNKVTYYGGAIYNLGTISSITNSTFTNNTATYGGAICNKGTMSNITNSTFTNNTATYGGAILNEGSCTISSISGCTFTKNKVTYYGGAIWNGGIINSIIGCTFTDNTATKGGAICNVVSTTILVCYNWWGSNSGPGSDQIFGSVDYSPWLRMIVTVSPTIEYNGSSIVTVSFNNTSDGTSIPGGVSIPDGTVVTFTSDMGTFNTPTAITTNGIATATFTATNTGTGLINATTDSQTVSINITVNQVGTVLVVSDATTTSGQGVNLTAALKDENGNPLTGKKVTFRINGTEYNAITDSKGIATLTYTPTKSGTYTITANFGNDTIYANSTGNNTLTVQPAAYLYLDIMNSKKDVKVGDTFILTYKLGNKGPDNASNVIISFQMPAGLEFINASVDNGTWTYNSTTRTVTWNLTNVEVGDPYLYLTVKALGSGSQTITPMITSETLNRNTDPLTSFTINIQKANSSNGSAKVNATSTTQTIPMQKTGIPIAGLILAVLAVLSGMLPKIK